MDEENLKMEDLLTDIEQQKSKAEEDREQLSTLKKDYLKKIEQLEEERAKVRKQQERILNKAKEKARFLLAKVEREASQIIEGLKDVDAESQISIRDKAIESARAWQKN